jgi:ribosomal protein S18 acetylase RimI-like enzyme
VACPDRYGDPVDDTSAHATVLRQASERDAPALIELWRAAGLGFRPEQVAAELAEVTRRDPDIVLVAEDSDGLAASVFGAYDGRRGWVNRLATRPDRRGEGLARALLARLEEALTAKGCRKVNLLITSDNAGVVEFYRGAGYGTADLIFMGKHLGEG